MKLNFLLRVCHILIVSTSVKSFATQPGIFRKTSHAILAPLTLLISFMHYLSIAIGMAFLLGSVSRYVQYRNNPNQTPMHRALFLGTLGIILILLPFITQKAIDPTTAKVIQYRLSQYRFNNRY